MESFNLHHADVFNQLKTQIDTAIAYLSDAAKSQKTADVVECRYYLRVIAISAEYLSNFLKSNFSNSHQRNEVLAALKKIPEYIYNYIEAGDFDESLVTAISEIERAFDSIVASGKLADMFSVNDSTGAKKYITEIANIFGRFSGKRPTPNETLTFDAKIQMGENKLLSDVKVTLKKIDRKKEFKFYTCDAAVTLTFPTGKRYSFGAMLNIHVGSGAEAGGAGLVIHNKFHSLRLTPEAKQKLNDFFGIQTPDAGLSK